MGLQMNLCQLLGAPTEVQCPECGAPQQTYWNDYDVECCGFNPAPGKVVLGMYCEECEHEWKTSYQVELIPVHVTQESKP